MLNWRMLTRRTFVAGKWHFGVNLHRIGAAPIPGRSRLAATVEDMSGANLRVHRQRLRRFVRRDFDGNRRLVRVAWEWRERGVPEKDASCPHLQHVADVVLRWF